MWKDNLEFYKSKSYLNNCTSIGICTKSSPRLSTNLNDQVYFNRRVSSAHQWVRDILGQIILVKPVNIHEYSLKLDIR